MWLIDRVLHPGWTEDAVVRNWGKFRDPAQVLCGIGYQRPRKPRGPAQDADTIIICKFTGNSELFETALYGPCSLPPCLMKGSVPTLNLGQAAK